MIRAATLLLLCAGVAPAWVASVEFPWATFPAPLWERELAWLKNIGVNHVSLPPARDPSQLTDVIRIIRRLNMEADLEGPVPEALQPQTRAHGGPLTDPPGAPARISVLAPDALMRSRQLLTSSKPALLWTDVEDTIEASGNGVSVYHPGAVSFAGVERAATIPLRRSAQLANYWGQTIASLHESPGAGTRLPAETISVKQFAGDNGTSFVSIVNSSAKPWTGDVKALYSPARRIVFLTNVTVPAHDSIWLPVDVPLSAGPLCKACTAFSTADHLVYATAELTSMEYENGILAMEFSAPTAGEVILQLSREPSGPLVAGGKPSEFDWDDKALRARLPIPAGKGPGDHVRIGLAIEAPDATAFFDSARVLLTGETNHLTAQFSSETIAQRSRLRIAPELPVSQDATKEPLQLIYHIKVPDTAVHGDHAELALEADGSQMSHARPQLLRPATMRFSDAIGVRLASNSVLQLSPAVVPVNQRSGREFTVTVRNNAPEIRTFHLEINADGLTFSPEKIDIPVGASASRDVSFRVFASGAAPGIHKGEARLSGAATGVEAVRFVVIPPSGAVAFGADGFAFLESAKNRASFLPGRWLEYIAKDNGQTSIPVGGSPFTAGPIEFRNDALVFAGQKVVRLQDLDPLLPKPKK